MNRYSLGIIGVLVGLLIMWAIFKFKNPFNK